MYKLRLLLLSTVVVFSACNGNKQQPANAEAGKITPAMLNNPASANGVDTVVAARKPVMTFADTLHVFGEINENEKVEHDFTFTNTGKTALVISFAKGSCGCTIPDYPRDPVQPGQSGVIKVTFNSAGKYGHQEKSVEIHTNTMRGVEMLFITADIKKKTDS